MAAAPVSHDEISGRRSICVKEESRLPRNRYSMRLNYFQRFPPRRVDRARVGVFGIGLHAYWAQFPGLKERLEDCQRHVETGSGQSGVEVVSAGLMDRASAAAEAGRQFAASSLDLIVCYVGTYATSSQVLPVVQRSRVSVLILNLQPTRALDYGKADTGEWLANCCACCVPEISNASDASLRPGCGHNRGSLAKLSELTGIPLASVC